MLQAENCKMEEIRIKRNNKNYSVFVGNSILLGRYKPKLHGN